MNSVTIDINHPTNRVKEYQVHLALLIIWFFFPILSTIPICLFIAHVNLSERVIKSYLFLLALVPAVINYTRVAESDLEVYYSVFTRFNANDLASVFDYSAIDLFFYYTTFFVAKLANGYTPIFSLFWSTFTYFTISIALFEFNKVLSPGKKSAVIAIIFYTIFVGIEFSLADHLVRQYVALSLSMLAIAKLCQGKKSYIIYFVLAFMSHYSTIVFLPLILISLLKKKTATILMISLAVLFFLVGRTNLLDYLPLSQSDSQSAAVATIVDKASVYANFEFESLSTRRIIEESLYVLICVYLFFKINATKDGSKSGTDNKGVYRFFVIFISFAIYILLIRNNNLLLLRYFFYFYFLSTFLLLILFRGKNYFAFLFMLFAVVTTPYRFLTSIVTGGFKYIDNSYSIVLISVPQFLSN